MLHLAPCGQWRTNSTGHSLREGVAVAGQLSRLARPYDPWQGDVIVNHRARSTARCAYRRRVPVVRQKATRLGRRRHQIDSESGEHRHPLECRRVAIVIGLLFLQATLMHTTCKGLAARSDDWNKLASRTIRIREHDELWTARFVSSMNEGVRRNQRDESSASPTARRDASYRITNGGHRCNLRFAENRCIQTGKARHFQFVHHRLGNLYMPLLALLLAGYDHAGPKAVAEPGSRTFFIVYRDGYGELIEQSWLWGPVHFGDT